MHVCVWVHVCVWKIKQKIKTSNVVFCQILAYLITFWQKLETATSFKHLGSVITDKDSKPEILSRIAQTAAALTRLKPVLNDRSISLSSKIQLMRSLVTSIFPYAWESWTLTAELQRRMQAMKMRCYWRILHISYKDHVPTGKSLPRSSRQLDHTKTFWRS